MLFQSKYFWGENKYFIHLLCRSQFYFKDYFNANIGE